MAFSRSNMVETSSSSSDSDDNIYDPARLMESPDPYSRLRINGRIKKLMKEFKNRTLEYNEVNSIKRLMSHQIKDFSESQKYES